MFFTIENKLKESIEIYLKEQDNKFDPKSIVLKKTEEHIEGDITLLVFPLSKFFNTLPELLADKIGKYALDKHKDLINNYYVIKGFLNFDINPHYWSRFIFSHFDKEFWKNKERKEKIVIEFSSPNTNKPLHLGHLRNNFIGESISRLLQVTAYQVHKTCVVNDRGIHICKSMLAWKKFANKATPQSTKIKGDHFVGNYYVRFENELKCQASQLKEQVRQHNFNGIEINAQQQIQKLLNIIKDDEIHKANSKLEEAIRNATPLMQEVRELLTKWEKGDAETLQLWNQMNEWVYDGFSTTYTTIGTTFDSIDYESNCYLLGKEIVHKGLEKKIFYQKEDGSIWVNLTNDQLDQKLLLRKDQTSVYITQDLGLIEQRFNKLQFDRCIYVVGNEQDYHFKVLKATAKKLKLPYHKNIVHLSYGMVELPSGKMKSREGTVVDADKLISQIVEMATETTKTLGKVDELDTQSQTELYKHIGLAAIKFYLLRVHPKKKMLFNPKESIDIQGFTGPFIQYTHARISSVLNQFDKNLCIKDENKYLINNAEKKVIIHIQTFPNILESATKANDPSTIANYVYQLAKKFNSFYASHSILKADSNEEQNLRLALSIVTQRILKEGLYILGIEAPNKM